jgi:hypothetical protein
MGKKNQEIKFEDYRRGRYAVTITAQVELKIPCAICLEEPLDTETSLEVLVGKEWKVICTECAMHHAPHLTEQLNNDRIGQLRDMEDLYGVIFAIDRLKERWEIEEEKEGSLEALV